MDDINVAILGPKGTFSELAAIKFFNSENIKDINIIYFDAIDEVFEYVSSFQTKINEKKEIYGVVPIENSIEGSVNLTMDCLQDYDVKIFGEIVLDIELMLCTKENNIQKPSEFLSPLERIKKIKFVYSHPHALAQSRKFLKKFKLKGIPCESTAKACEMACKKKNAGAIASKEAARIYNLNILFENIEDYKSQTRFIVIHKEERKENFKNNKTSIIFSSEDKPGALYNILKEFAEKNINLKKIESRPSKRKLGEYFFFVDIEGNLKDNNLKKAIDNIKSKTNILKILGSY